MCITGTDEAVWDSDGGGVPDGEELLVLTNPLDAADDVPALDTDGDGVPDDAEHHWFGTDPRVQDTDGGGAPDGAELAAGADPGYAGDDEPLRLLAPTATASEVRCPVERGSPKAKVSVVFGTAQGPTPVPGCPGTFLKIANARPVGSANVDNLGRADVVRLVTGLSGRTAWFQAVEKSTCSVSEVVSVVFP